MGESKAKGIAGEIIRMENYIPGLQIFIEKAEAEAAEVLSKKLAGKSVTEKEEELADLKVVMAERAPKRYETYKKVLQKNLLAAVKEEREGLKLKRETLRPKEAQAKEVLRKKLAAIMLEAQVTRNCMRGEVYLVDLLKEVSLYFDDRYPEGQDHASEYKNLTDQAEVESKEALKDSVISQGAELDRLIAINENKNIDFEVEEILTRAREDAALVAASK